MKVFSHQDADQLKPGQHLVLGHDVLITPLAKDRLKSLEITLERQDQSQAHGDKNSTPQAWAGPINDQDILVALPRHQDGDYQVSIKQGQVRVCETLSGACLAERDFKEG